LKTTIAGKIVFERFNENEKLVTKLNDETRDLKHDLKTTQTSNLEIDKQIKEL
jgi:hypothetical protein